MEPSKQCTKCLLVKPLSEFHSHNTGSMGRHCHCKQCRSIQAKARAQKNIKEHRRKCSEATARWAAKNPTKRREVYVLSRFGKTVEEIDSFISNYVNSHGLICNSCGKKCDTLGGIKKPGLNRLVLDHSHTTGELRSMLCDFCNTSLGKLGDSSEGVSKLLAYIKRHES